jgi:hypothetical protein
LVDKGGDQGLVAAPEVTEADSDGRVEGCGFGDTVRRSGGTGEEGGEAMGVLHER